MATNEPLQLNLGSLRSAMSLTLHTHHASRIWHGRAAAEGRPGIVGLNGFVAVMNKMKRGSEQDDPYSDWWMLRIEEKLEQTKGALQTLREQVDQALADVPPASLKGLLKPFKGKGTLDAWASQCMAMRDGLVALAQRRILPQAHAYPFRLLDAHLAQQTTGAGTSFLRWRNLDRSAMGVTLWQALMDSPVTPVSLLEDLYAMEQQRIVLNMQISLTHSIARQARECAGKLAQAEDT